MVKTHSAPLRRAGRRMALLVLFTLSAAGFGCNVSYTVMPALLDRQDFPTGLTPSALAVSDLNQDGRPEVLVVHRGSHNFSLLWNQSTGADFAFRQVDYGVVPDGTPSGIAVADLNGDRLPDVVVLIESAGVINVRLNRGDGTLGEPLQLATAARPTAVVILDADRDGAPDLIVNSEDQGSVYLLRNEGGGTRFGAAQLVVQDFDAVPSALAVTDADGDGRLDLVVGRKSSGQVGVLFNKGSGRFQEQSYALGINPSVVVMADVDHDGRLDILTGDEKRQKIVVLLCQPDGSFKPDAAFTVAGALRGLAVGAVHGNGYSDVLVTLGDIDQVELLLNPNLQQGTDHFFAENFAVGRQPGAIALADVNGN